MVAGSTWFFTLKNLLRLTTENVRLNVNRI